MVDQMVAVLRSPDLMKTAVPASGDDRSLPPVVASLQGDDGGTREDTAKWMGEVAVSIASRGGAGSRADAWVCSGDLRLGSSSTKQLGKRIEEDIRRCART